MSHLPFTKMHGAGNDFIVIDNRKPLIANEEIISLAPALCHRRFGIGADGILALLPAADSSVDYIMFYRNADGSDAGMCGNGARCLALFAAEAGLGTSLTFKVHDTVYRAEVDESGQYVTLFFPMQVEVQEIDLPGEAPLFQAYAGTEHIVSEIPSANFKDDEALRAAGKHLRYHERFNPPGTNVNFICGESSNEINIKTYERGVEDLTMACGTGAIASAITWHHMHHSDAPANTIQVKAEGGTLNVHFSYNPNERYYSDIQLGGKARFVFDGRYRL